MINYNKVGKFSQIKYALLQFYSKNKLKIIFLIFLIVLFLLTGVFTALKISDIEKALKSTEFSFEAITNGNIYDFSFFIKRYLSILFVMFLLFIFSLNKFISIFGFVLIGYRAFLITLNCTLIIRYVGIGGIINAIVIILPCQILYLLLMSLFFIILCLIQKEKKMCGKANPNYSKCALLTILASFIVNVLELFLLIMFKATTILIIWHKY